MFSKLAIFALLAGLVAAADCEPTTTSPPPTTSTTPPPPPSGVALHPNTASTKCLDVQGAVFANGTPVQVYDCNGTGAQKWVINRGNGQVKVAGTNFCLDAGSSPADGTKMKIWQCYDGLAAQQWYWTGDNRIALTNQGFCLDNTGGSTSNGNPVQIWSCGTGNNNQVWTAVTPKRRAVRYSSSEE